MRLGLVAAFACDDGSGDEVGEAEGFGDVAAIAQAFNYGGDDLGLFALDLKAEVVGLVDGACFF